MARHERFVPPLFRLYQAAANADGEALKASEARGTWIHVAYDLLVAYFFSLAMTALSLTLPGLPMNWTAQVPLQLVVFAAVLITKRFWKWVAIGAAVIAAGALAYLVLTKRITPFWVDTVLPLTDFFYDMGSYMSGFEVANARPNVYAALVGGGIAVGSAILVYLSYHPWIMMIAAGSVYAASLKEPSIYQTVFLLLALFLFFVRLAKKRDFATVQQAAVVRRARISSNRYIRTALPIVMLLMTAVLFFHWLLPADAFYSKTLDDLVSRITGYSFNEDKSIGYYEFSLRTSGFYPLDTQLGGPVTPSVEPYLEITAGQHSVYLRGAVYATYTGQLWHQDSMDPNWMFDHPRNLEVQRDVLGLPLYASVTSGDSVIEPSPRQPLAIVPIREQQVVFSGGRLDSLNYLLLEEEMYAYYNISGTMYSDQVIPDNGYLAGGEAFRVDLLHRRDVLASLSLGFAGNATPRINRDGDVSRWLQLPEMPALEAAVQAHDELLYDLVYGQPSLPRYEHVLAIRERLAETLTYELDVPAPSADSEFVTWFLETKEGYCTYFGTALTVLLREAGIPARYVEGFLVPAMQGGGARVITGEQAHAWSEVWFDGMGWIPLDATPQSTLDQMNQEEQIEEQPEPDQTEPEPEQTEPEPTPELEEPDVPEDLPDASYFRTLFRLLLTILKWLLIFSPLVAYFVWRVLVWRKRHDVPYLVKRFRDREKELIISVWKDLQAIWGLQGVRAMEDETVRQFFVRLLQARNLDLDPNLTTYESVEKALYSEHEFDSREVVDLLVLYRREEQKAKRQLPWYTWLFQRFLWSPKHPL
ncbi:MAG TPA: transglutaminase domain-containing protein [Clostridiaceae bacterium]|nr:transglutaminase domain-containing protein [Clostridiaceae bacterium]